MFHYSLLVNLFIVFHCERQLGRASIQGDHSIIPTTLYLNIHEFDKF